MKFSRRLKILTIVMLSSLSLTSVSAFCAYIIEYNSVSFEDVVYPLDINVDKEGFSVISLIDYTPFYCSSSGDVLTDSITFNFKFNENYFDTNYSTNSDLTRDGLFVIETDLGNGNLFNAFSQNNTSNELYRNLSVFYQDSEYYRLESYSESLTYTVNNASFDVILLKGSKLTIRIPLDEAYSSYKQNFYLHKIGTDNDCDNSYSWNFYIQLDLNIFDEKVGYCPGITVGDLNVMSINIRGETLR